MVISIYGYLDQRYGKTSYKTGAWFFLLSKLLGAAARLYLVALILQTLVFDAWGVPFVATVIGVILIIWLYSFKSGIKTIIWTDTIQTALFLIALVLIIWQLGRAMTMNVGEMTNAIVQSPHSRIWVFDDWVSTQNFLKQFFSGMFITIVMTGLDQDQMQKNLTIKNLKDAKKNVITYGFAFIPVNLLFLSLGVLLLIFAQRNNITLPEISDEILPYIVSSHLGSISLGIFVVGIVAAAFSSADSALAALTTSFCVDILGMKNEEKSNNVEKQNIKTRRIVHVGVSTVFVIVIMIIHSIGSDSIINAIYKLASYTYGPLLGMYFMGLYSKIKPVDKYVPYVAVASPLICMVVEIAFKQLLNYQVGYELLLINGAITAFGLWILSKNNKQNQLITN